MTVSEIVTLGLAALGIIATTLIAIYSLRKTAEESRVSGVHSEMCDCLVSTIGILRIILNLVEDVTHNVVYKELPKGELGEKAFDRYWRRIGELSDKFDELVPKQRLFLPSSLYENLGVIINNLNVARRYIRFSFPNNSDQSSDQDPLHSILEEAGKNYREFVNQARSYIGSDKLTQLIEWKEPKENFQDINISQSNKS